MSSSEGSTVIFRRVPIGVRRVAVQRFARKLQSEVAGGRSFDCVISGDAELRRLNRDFRGKDEATDVLSFPVGQALSPANPRGKVGQALSPANPRGKVGQALSPANPPAKVGQALSPAHPRGPLGDIAISSPRARAQARQFGHSLETEIRILMLHGVLHLLGMDHATDAGRMARAEKRWRSRLGLPNGLIERVQS